VVSRHLDGLSPAAPTALGLGNGNGDADETGAR